MELSRCAALFRGQIRVDFCQGGKKHFLFIQMPVLDSSSRAGKPWKILNWSSCKDPRARSW